jgi:hypothetical protein
LDLDRGRAAARRRGDRAVRPGDDGAGRRGQLPALGGRDSRGRREGATPGGRAGAPRLRARDLPDGWRFILASPALRPLFWNTITVNSLIMATEPLIAVLMLGRLGFAPWQFGLAFAAPCIGA